MIYQVWTQHSLASLSDPGTWQLGLLQNIHGFTLWLPPSDLIMYFFSPNLCAVLAEHASAVGAEFSEATLTLASSLFPASPFLLGPSLYGSCIT